MQCESDASERLPPSTCVVYATRTRPMVDAMTHDHLLKTKYKYNLDLTNYFHKSKQFITTSKLALKIVSEKAKTLHNMYFVNGLLLSLCQ